MARLTPAGTGAIAVLALRGPSAWSLVKSLAAAPLPDEPPLGRFWLRRLVDAERGQTDDVVVAVRQWTPEPCVEIHCHGGIQVVGWLEELLTGRGATLCSWQEWEKGSLGDAVQAAALEVLTSAATARTAAIALDQFRGAFANALRTVRSALLADHLATAARVLTQLESTAHVGRHLDQPWRIVIAGAVNVGKSSLANALAGYQRSVVSPQAGTTRDVVTTLLAIDGWPVEIADTAGWRDADGAVEQEGIARARIAAADAEICIWVVDAGAPPVWPDVNLRPALTVINKVDLPPAWDISSISAVRVSAATGAGIPDLCQRLSAVLVPNPPPPGAAVAFTDALAQGISEIAECVRKGATSAALEKLEGLTRECD
jgi:tRNA modification GTPase